MFTLNPTKGREVFYTADTHFNHERVLRLSNRPFASIQEHDATIIERWNATVADSDYVVFAGDFCMLYPGDDKTPLARSKVAVAVLQHLKGHIYWTTGNHDRLDLPYITNRCHNVKILGCPIMVNNGKVSYPDTFVSHYPHESWLGSCGDVIHLHGHVHGALDHVNKTRYTIDDGGGAAPFYRYDCGVDSNNFTPVNISDVFTKITSQCTFKEQVLWV